jgi:hypothetical protein
MAKQLLIYERAVPVSSERHRDHSVRTGQSYGFAREINSVPLLTSEFITAATQYPIIFAGAGDQVMPAALFGLRDNENLYVDDAGKWTGGYIPAFLRRYPFVFAKADGEDDGNFTLCIDEEFDGLNTEGRGERLFDSEGNRTQYLQSVLEFSRQFQAQFTPTRRFAERLNELELLEPAQAQYQMPDGKPGALSGFSMVSRDKLKALPDATAGEMLRSGELELCFLQLHSLGHISTLAERAAAAFET